MVLSNLAMVFIYKDKFVVVLKFLNKKLAHLDEIQYVKKDKSTLPTPPPPPGKDIGSFRVNSTNIEKCSSLTILDFNEIRNN